MKSTEPNEKKVDYLVRTAVVLVTAGLLLVFLFLIFGFRSWSVGLGIFLGGPLVMVGVIVYIISVIRDLRHHRVFDD